MTLGFKRCISLSVTKQFECELGCTKM